MGAPSARGCTGLACTAGRSSSQASTTRRRCSSTATRSRITPVLSRRSASTFREGEHLLAVAVHAAPGERGAGRQDEPRPRAQEPHGLRLGLLPAADPPGHLAPRDARPAARDLSDRDVARRCRHGRGGGETCSASSRRSSGGRTAWASNGSTARATSTSASGRSSSTDYRFLVNGVEMPIRGWNWVPLDVLYGVPRPEKLARLLGLAARANVNLLRVWGGGLIESHEFYDLCDRLGSSSGRSSSSRARASRASLRRSGVRRDDGLGRARDRAPTAPPSVARGLVRWQRARRRRLDAPCSAALREVVRELDPARVGCRRPPLGDRGRARAHGSTRACASTTSTTTRVRRCCTASSASRA